MARSRPLLSLEDPPRRLVMAYKRCRAVGIVSPSYGSEKVSYGLLPGDYTFHKLYRVPVQRLEKRGTFWGQTPILLDHPVELVHTFNELPIGLRPFLVSFENELPRYLGTPKSSQLDFGFRLLESSRCRKILALSQAAASAFREQLMKRGMSSLIRKLGVFRGGVRVGHDDSATLRSENAPLRVLFVGRDAFGKGLLPTLDALDECRSQGRTIEATILCNFVRRTYISKGRDADVTETLDRMRRTPGVTYHPTLSNADTHQLMRSHDVLVFPTLDDSLGWVAVEAGMAGMAVIATDIFAVPELVIHGETGFLIPMHKNEKSRWIGLWLEGEAFDREVAATFETIREHLALHLMRMTDAPPLVRSMGQASRMHMQSLYSVDAARATLGRIYATALGKEPAGS